MKLQAALDLIEQGKKYQECPPGFMVNYQHKEGVILCSGHFPDKHGGEPLIPTEDEAWALAEQFAAFAPSDYVNIYVIKGNFVPVENYKERKLREY